MSPLTLVQAIAEFRRAGLPVDPDHYDSLCPVCRRMLKIADDQGNLIYQCSEGCDSARIADALHSLAQRNPDAPLEAPVRSCWEPVDLLPLLTGEHVEERAEILRRTDGT